MKATKENHLLLSQRLLELLTSTLGLAVLDRLLTQLLLVERSSVRVESQHNLLVAQRVLLLHVGTLGAGLPLGLAQHRLNFGGVDDAGDVSVGKEVGRQEEVLLQGRSGRGGAVDLIQGSERR